MCFCVMEAAGTIKAMAFGREECVDQGEGLQLGPLEAYTLTIPVA